MAGLPTHGLLNAAPWGIRRAYARCSVVYTCGENGVPTRDSLLRNSPAASIPEAQLSEAEPMYATLLELRLHVQDEHDWLALDLLLATLAAQGKLGVTEPLLRTKLEKQRHGLGWGHRDALKTLRDLILALEGQTSMQARRGRTVCTWESFRRGKLRPSWLLRSRRRSSQRLHMKLDLAAQNPVYRPTCRSHRHLHRSTHDADWSPLCR